VEKAAISFNGAAFFKGLFELPTSIFEFPTSLESQAGIFAIGGFGDEYPDAAIGFDEVKIFDLGVVIDADFEIGEIVFTDFKTKAHDDLSH